MLIKLKLLIAKYNQTLNINPNLVSLEIKYATSYISLCYINAVYITLYIYLFIYLYIPSYLQMLQIHKIKSPLILAECNPILRIYFLSVKNIQMVFLLLLMSSRWRLICHQSCLTFKIVLPMLSFVPLGFVDSYFYYSIILYSYELQI